MGNLQFCMAGFIVVRVAPDETKPIAPKRNGELTRPSERVSIYTNCDNSQ